MTLGGQLHHTLVQQRPALQQSEARFQKIAAASPAQIYILVTRLDGSLIRFEYISPATSELRKLSPEELLQDPSPVYNQIHPDDRASYFVARNHSLTTMEPFFHEYRIVLASGEVKWVRVNSRPERRENKEVFWYGIILDVSDRKRAEAALQRSEERWQLAIRGSNDGIWDWDIKTDKAFRSDRFYEILGCFKQDLGIDEQSWVGSIHPEDIEQVMKAKQDYLDRKIPTFAMEYRMRCQNTNYKWVLDRAIAVWDKQGNPIRMIGSLGDIDDRKQAEAALRESEQRFRSLIENLQVGVTLHRLDSRFLLSNLAAQSLLGLTEAQLLDKTLVDPYWKSIYEDGHVFPPDAFPVIQAIATGKPIRNVVIGIYRNDRSLVWLLVNAAPQFEQNGSVSQVICTFSDITDRKQIEQQLRTSLKEKEVLLREVYHRVKNNMQLVSSLLSLQASTIADPAILRLLNESQQRVKTMAIIHERLYRSNNLARINTATYILDLVNNLILFYKTTGSSIQMNLDVAELELDLDVAVPCSLIINELVSNALKYAFPDQQGEIKLQFW